MALRIGQLLLFFPGLFALYLLVRRFASPQAAGWSAVLFATTRRSPTTGRWCCRTAPCWPPAWRTALALPAAVRRHANARNWLACAGARLGVATLPGRTGGGRRCSCSPSRAAAQAGRGAAGGRHVPGVAAWRSPWLGTSASTPTAAPRAMCTNCADADPPGEPRHRRDRRPGASSGEAMAAVWFEHFNTACSSPCSRSPDRPAARRGAAAAAAGRRGHAAARTAQLLHVARSITRSGHGFAGLCVRGRRAGAGQAARASALVLAGRAAIGGHLLHCTSRQPRGHRDQRHHRRDAEGSAVARWRHGDDQRAGHAATNTSMAYAIDTAEKLQGFVALGRDRSSSAIRSASSCIREHADPELVRALDPRRRRSAPDGIPGLPAQLRAAERHRRGGREGRTAARRLRHRVDERATLWCTARSASSQSSTASMT